jgi:hypothetical protein
MDPREPVPLHDDEFLIVELDDRFEFGVAVVDDDGYDWNAGCNSSNCTQNAYCPG